ncbi:uncharacterized protein LOC120333756 isoform X1 [Styela clava]
MADIPNTGGGKIRSRRAASSRKPYSRASSQKKTLFSRVTDTFKNLLNPFTPKWLTNRMNHETDDQGSPSTRQNQVDRDDRPSTSSNHQETHSCTNSNRGSPIQPRPPLFSSKISSSSVQCFVTPPDTPPVSQQNLTPSASTSLSRSGGSRKAGKEDLLKHLNTMSSKRVKIDSESPIESESSFLRKEMKYLSANDNASVASSSGCSSSMQASQRTNTSADNEGTGSQKNLWTSSMDSLASSRTSSSHQQPTMTSHKRPRFNPAIFGMPAVGSSSAPDLNQSSFYNGPVQFGGANASGRSGHFATPYKIPSVTKVKVRHINHQRTPVRSSMHSTRNTKSELEESSATGMSSTAKKILQTLEKMSSPLNDARRIPMTRTPSSFMADRQKRRTIGGSSRLGTSMLQPPPTVGISSPSTARLRRRSHMPMNNSLLVRKQPQFSERREMDDTRDDPGPSTIAIPDSKSISVRGLPGPISSMTSSASMPKRNSRSSFGNEGYGGGGGGKMKSQKRTSAHYSSTQNDEEEMSEVPDLPNVPLPLSNLPSFNFGKSMMTSTPTIRPAEKKKSQLESNQPEFNFASPLVKTTNTDNGKVQSSTTNTPKFQFSSPPTKSSSIGDEQETPKARPGSNFNSGSKNSTPTLMFAPDPKIVSAVKATKRRSSPLATPNNAANSSSDGIVTSSEALKAGSVMDILGGKKTKADSTSSPLTSGSSSLPPLTQNKSGWRCDVCMLQNDDATSSCVACATPKPGGAIKPLQALTSNNKGWRCDICMVQNDAENGKCEACETPKPGSAVTNAPKKLSGGLFGSGNTNIAPTNPKFSFGIKPNKESDNNDQKSLGSMFKKPTGSWNCESCFLRNDASNSTCEACQTPKSGASASLPNNVSSNTSEKAPTFKFGMPSKSAADSTTKPSLGSLFKKAPGSWECEVCMVKNNPERKTCEACESPKPGTKKELNTSFKFGDASAGIIKFGIPDVKAQVETSKITIENKNEEKPKQDPTISQTNAEPPASSNPSFQFGAPAAASAPTFGSTEQKPGISAPTFGVKPPVSTEQPCSTEPEKPKTTGLFSFGVPKTNNASSEPVAKDVKQPGFTFGAQQPTSSAPESSGFKFGVQAPASSTPPLGNETKPSSTAFSAQPTLSTAPVSNTATIPTFGVSTNPLSQTTLANSSLGGFGGFKAPTVQAPTKPEEQKSAASTFSFGQNKPAQSGGTFQFSGSNATEPANPTCSSNAAANKTLFGLAQSASAQESKPTFSFGKQQDKPVSTGFTGFGNQSTGANDANKPSTFSGFGATNQQTNAPAAEPPKSTFGGFGFGSPAPAVSLPSGGVFGSTPFGASTASSNSQPFGSSNSASVQPSPFGQTSSTESTGMFGTNRNPPPPFGAQLTNNANPGIPKPSFAFGASSNNEPSQQKTPAFGGFQFGGNNEQNAAPAQQSGFNFGASSAAPVFGGTPNKPPPAFNATSAAPAAGFQFGNSSSNQSNGMFQFGAGSNQSKPEQPAENKSGMFVFGGNNPASNNTQQQQSTGFNFGASTAPSSFNFSGSQPAASQNAFTGSAPNAAFTGSTPNANPFNAAPSGATPGGRRVRQARRRLKK